MKVICISGKAQHGKTTVANLMKHNLESKEKKVLIASYAGLVKYVCKTFFDWDGKKDEKGRKLLQKVGTDIVRKEDPDYWVSFMIDMLYFFGDNWDYVIIDDCRFPNEITELLAAGYAVKYVNVIRTNFESSLTAEAREHISENAIHSIVPDFEIINSGTLTDLDEAVDEMIALMTGKITMKQYHELEQIVRDTFNKVMRVCDTESKEGIIALFRRLEREIGL